MMGQLSNVWYDRRQISPAAPDDDSIDTMAASLVQLVDAEIQLGIPADKIIIGLQPFYSIFIQFFFIIKMIYLL